MSLSTPVWLRKPQHKDKVIATERGWVVESTGEVLVRVRNLPTLLANHFGVPVQLGSSSTAVPEKVEADPVVVNTTTETQVVEVVKVDLPPDPTLTALGAVQLPVTEAKPVVPETPVTEVKVRKKPGPKPKPKVVPVEETKPESATTPVDTEEKSEVDSLLDSL